MTAFGPSGVEAQRLHDLGSGSVRIGGVDQPGIRGDDAGAQHEAAGRGGAVAGLGERLLLELIHGRLRGDILQWRAAADAHRPVKQGREPVRDRHRRTAALRPAACWR